VCAELGLEMSNSDIKQMMEEVDLDKNGVIDRSEFELWWLSGRKGATGTMAKVLAAKLGGKAFFDSLNAAGKTLSQQVVSGQYKHMTQNIEIGFNSSKQAEEKDGLQVFARASSFGKPSEKAQLEMKTRCDPKNEFNDEGILFNVTLKVKESFTDPNGFFKDLAEFFEDQGILIKFEENKLYVYGVWEERI